MHPPRQHSGDQNLYWTKFLPGQAWTADVQFPNHLSGAGPAAVVYRDKTAPGTSCWSSIAAGAGTGPPARMPPTSKPQPAAEHAAAATAPGAL
ncbi:hypothetical protein AB0I94_28725 [Streptomyces sp. NPDC050147]|uniref:hypothetical protein n=1 Tax=Streptomyces sp. NPDC050147 TaxID=3155513 RepID=UPI00343F0FEF